MTETRIMLAGIRKIIAEKMKKSQLDNPHASGYLKVDMTEVLKLKKEYESKNINISMSSILIKAIAVAMKKFPQMNSRLEGEEIITYDDVNVGVGVALPYGLIAVVVKEAQTKSLEQISKELSHLIEKANKGQLTLDEMTGSTITVSNLSMSKVEAFTSIINNNECLIIGLGGIKKELVVNKDDTTSIRQMSNLCFNINHAILDGYPGTMFGCELAEIMEKPYVSLI